MSRRGSSRRGGLFLRPARSRMRREQPRESCVSAPLPGDAAATHIGPPASDRGGEVKSRNGGKRGRQQRRAMEAPQGGKIGSNHRDPGQYASGTLWALAKECVKGRG